MVGDTLRIARERRIAPIFLCSAALQTALAVLSMLGVPVLAVPIVADFARELALWMAIAGGAVLALEVIVLDRVASET